MKKIILSLVIFSSISAFASDLISMPMSCYKGVKVEGRKYAVMKYPGSHIKIPQIAYDMGNGRISIIVKIINEDWDYPGNLYVPAIVNQDQCIVGTAHE